MVYNSHNLVIQAITKTQSSSFSTTVPYSSPQLTTGENRGEKRGSLTGGPISYKAKMVTVYSVNDIRLLSNTGFSLNSPYGQRKSKCEGEYELISSQRCVDGIIVLVQYLRPGQY